MKAVAIVAVGGTAVLFAGCASDTMNRVVQSWHGEHIEVVVKQWGYPNAERDFRGRKLYVWNDSTVIVLPSYTSTSGTVTRVAPGMATVQTTTTEFGGGPVHTRCERVLEVDEAGFVRAGSWGGNGCCVATLLGRCATWPNPHRSTQ